LSVMGMSVPIEAVGFSQEMRAAVLENLSDGVYFVNRTRRILYWNKGAEQITGFSADDVVGRRCKDNILSHCDEAGTILCGSHCPLLDAIQDGKQREAHVYLHHKDGHRKPVRIRAAPIRDAEGNVIGAVETFHDDSALVDTRRRAADLQRASMSDALTGVGNRRLGEATLHGLIEQHAHSHRPFGVLFADIDLFKGVNDRFGHEVGDEALRVIARTLADTSRHDDEVIRWGGEEFLVVLADADPATLALVAERLRVMVMQTRLYAQRRRVPLRISIGGTLAAPGDTPDLILRRADALLYQSKNAGRNRVTLDVDQ
jgi:diguanylate cyclase (GGDEF)-like protein/PAS domain S-box-containing protein